MNRRLPIAEALHAYPPPDDAASTWRLVAGAQRLASMFADAVPMRFSRRAASVFHGDIGAAQIIPTYPNLAVSVDIASGNGRRQTLRPQAPGRTISAPLP